MTIQRIADLTAPPIIGKFYLVPAVFFLRERGEKARWWPIIGPKHEDAEDFNFEQLHYHVDVRFAGKQILDHFPNWFSTGSLGGAIATPLQEPRWSHRPLPAPEIRKFKCVRNRVDYPFAEQPIIQRLNTKWAGEQAVRAKSGWICPHRNALIGTFEPDEHGIITCPLHGLRIDAATGKCVGPFVAQQVAA